MKITNAKVFIEKAFVQGGISFDEKIQEAGAQVTGAGDLDAQGCYLIPGLIDLHTHGAMGADASDGSVEGIVKMSGYYAAQGVTSWCPTTMTLKEPELTKAVQAVRAFHRPEDGAKIAGIHLEGPFINYSKRGAQNPENLHVPDAAMFRRLYEASGEQICLITMAPEEPGTMEFIKEIAPLCTISIGHTTADYDTAMKAFSAGASHVTHLYNAMPPIHHREPGVIAAASDSGAAVELITDGLHVHPSIIRLTQKLFGDKLVLISDSLRCAGMPDGDYELGGQPITMRNGKATLTGTDTLAGSSIHLMDGLRRSVSFGVPLEAAVYAATAAPAAEIRKEQEIGSLKPGLSADFVLLDEQLQVKDVYINGTSIHSRG